MRARFTSLLLALLVVGTARGLEAQQRQVTGTVTGPDQAPIPAATVVITGRRAGVLTDAEGRFTIQAPAGDASLTVSRIGFSSRTVAVPAGQGSVNVRLQADVLNLEAVVVTGQATTVKRQNVANAVSVVTSQDLQRAPAQTIEKALQGKIAGANISTNSGAPGGGVQISLRGVSSIGGSADPLFVVDGVIMSNVSIPSGANAVSQASRGVNSSSQDQLVNRIADINPNDIESIEVLKGASASAIYGSKASNGVIIIRTKRGQAGAMRVNLTQRVGYSELANRLGSRTWTREAAIERYNLTPAEADRWFNADGTQKQVFDNEEAVFGRQAPGRETILSLSGGNERTRFYLSGTVMDNEGLAQNTGYAKEALQLNLDQALGSRVQVQVGASVIHSVAARGLTGNDNAGVSYYTGLAYTPSFFDLSRQPDGSFPNNGRFSIQANPVQTAALSTNDENVWRAITSANVAWTAVENEKHNLRLLANGGVDYFEQRNELYYPAELLFEDDDNLPGTAILGQGQNTNLNLGVNLVYTFTPSDRVTARTSVGTQYEDRDLQLSQIVGRNTTSRIPARAALKDVDGSRSRSRDFGMYVQEELLLLDERLTLTGSVRADRSSNNADADKYYYYPKASASYRMDDVASFLDELKLRLAYGSSGNLPFYGQRFNSALGGTNLEGVLGFRVGSNVGDPELHPERTTEVEGGFDAVLFGGNARFEATAYQKTVTDFIISPPLAPSTGFGAFATNAGSYEVKGVELMLEATPVRRDNFQWLTRTTFATDRAEVTDLGSFASYNPGFHFGFDYGGYRIAVGESPTALWGNDVDAEGNRIERVFGDAMPEFRMGFSNDFTFRSFTLATLVDWAKGGLASNLTLAYYDDSETGLDWQACNTADTCRGSERSAASGQSTQYLQDAGYVKLREVSLAYQLPDRLLGAFAGRVRSARLSVSARNLKTWTNYEGLDPEVSNFGNRAVGRNQDVTPFPPYRSFWLALDLGF